MMTTNVWLVQVTMSAFSSMFYAVVSYHNTIRYDTILCTWRAVKSWRIAICQQGQGCLWVPIKACTQNKPYKPKNHRQVRIGRHELTVFVYKYVLFNKHAKNYTTLPQAARWVQCNAHLLKHVIVCIIRPITLVLMVTVLRSVASVLNKCIGDDKKATARQSLNCIKKQNKKYGDGLTPCSVARSWHWFCQETAPCNVACGCRIMTVNSPSGSTLQCDMIRGSGMTCHWIRPVAAPCNVTRSSGIMTLNSPGGSTLQCGRWLWDIMPLDSPKRPPYWNSTSGFDFDHITAVSMSFCTSLRNIIQIRPPSAKKGRHVDFQDGGSQPSWISGVQ